MANGQFTNISYQAMQQATQSGTQFVVNGNDPSNNPQSIISALQNIATALYALSAAVAAVTTVPANP